MCVVRMSLSGCRMAAVLGGCLALGALAAAFTPQADSQVLERVPARASDPAARELQALRQVWRAAPQNLPAALRLAERCFEEVAATGDPRFIGCAQAALQPWWALPRARARGNDSRAGANTRALPIDPLNTVRGAKPIEVPASAFRPPA